MPAKALRILLLLLSLLVGWGALATSVATPKGPVEVPESTFEGSGWVCASEVAKAFDGTYSVDATYKRPVLQVLGHRILLSEETAVFSMDGKVLRLSRPPLKRDSCLWLPSDFLGYLGTVTPSARSRPPAEAPQAPAAAPHATVAVTCDPEGKRLTLQGPGISEARVRDDGKSVEVLLQGGTTFGALPKLPAAGLLERVEAVEGGRGLRVGWRAGASGEALKLRNPDRLVLAGRAAPAVQPPVTPPPVAGASANAPASVLPPPSPAPSPAPSMTNGPGLDLIVLDPGHGGLESGAEGPDGLLEKDLTLAVALRAQAALEKAGFKVILTRTTDETVPLASRTVFANTRQADLFISIHMNSSPSPKARGTETYYHSTVATDHWASGLADRENATPPGQDEGREGISLVLWDLAQTAHIQMSAKMAELAQREFNDLLATRDRGVRQAPFAVLQGAQMPAVLLEVAFLSNPSEAKRLADPEFQEQVAQSLAAAVRAFRTEYGGPSAPAAPAHAP